MSEDRFLAHDWFARPLPLNVVIGERSWLYSTFAFGHYRSRRPCGVRVGHDTGIYIGTFFDLGPAGEVWIGDFCTIAGPVIATNRRVVIEDYALISFGVVIADSFAAVPPRSAHLVGPERGDPLPEEPSIVIGENAWIGARAVLLAGARIGEGAIVGAATVVDFEVPPFAITAGNPPRIVGSIRP